MIVIDLRESRDKTSRYFYLKTRHKAQKLAENMGYN